MLSRRKLQVLFIGLTLLLFSLAGIGCVFGIRYCFVGSWIPTVRRADWGIFVIVHIIVYMIDLVLFSNNRDLVKKNFFRLCFERGMIGVLMFAVLSMSMVLTKSSLGGQRKFLIECCTAYVVCTLVGLLLLRRMLHRFYKTRLSVLTGVITVSDRAEALVQSLYSHWTRKIVGVALLDPIPVGVGAGYASAATGASLQSVSGIPVKAGRDNFMDWVRSESLDEVYIDLPFEGDHEIRPILEEIQSMGIAVHLNIAAVENLTNDIELHMDDHFKILNGKPMLTFCLTKHNPWALMVKRAMDIVIGLVGSILSLPIILLVAIPLKIESPGPLIFKQKRMGKNGRVFNVYKLRSMYKDAEARKAELMSQNEMNGLMFKMKDDPRITKVGKFIRKTSIDELPQFWNILKGDMSFVGTRPPTLAEYEKYSSHHKRRLSMKPGLTGMWQVSGRSQITDFEEVVRLDVQYIDEWSLRLDLKIMLKTVWIVLTGRGSE